jgi:hypothetical protein
MVAAVQHGCEPKELAYDRLIYDNLLAIFIDCSDAHLPGKHDISLTAGLTHLIDALARRVLLVLDLAGQYSRFIIVEERKERDLSKR